MTNAFNQGQQATGRTLPDLPTRIGLFGALTAAAAEATPFDVVIAIASSGITRR